jgi:hypothetical protein
MGQNPSRLLNERGGNDLRMGNGGSDRKEAISFFNMAEFRDAGNVDEVPGFQITVSEANYKIGPPGNNLGVPSLFPEKITTFF